MAEQKGIDGVVKVGTDNILNVTNFTIEETSETLDITSMSSTGNAREILPTFTAFSGSFDGYWDASDNAMKHSSGTPPIVRSGETLTFEFYPEGESTGALYYSGSGIVTSVSRSAAFDGAVEFSVAFEGTGVLTYGIDT